MNFRIADTFTSSLTRLTGTEQKAVKTTCAPQKCRPNLAQTDGIMPIVRRTARFNQHRDLIIALFKHPPARRILFRALTA